MSRLLDANLSKPYDKPVKLVEVDWSNPMTRGLIGCYLIQESGESQFVNLAKPGFNDADYVGGVVPPPVGTDYKYGRYNEMIAAQTHYWDCGQFTELHGAAEATLVIGHKKNGASNFLVTGYFEGASNTSWGLELWSDSNMYCIFNNATGGESNFSMSGVNLDWHTHVLTYNGNRAATGADRLQAYQDGVAKTLSFSYTPGTTILASTSANFRIGRDSANSVYTSGYVSFVYVFKRHMTEAEAVSISRDPYQLFKPLTPFSVSIYPAIPTVVTEPQVYTRTLSDSITILDSLIRSIITEGGTVYERTLTSSISIYDTQTRIAEYFRTIIETLDVDDMLVQSALMRRLLQDSVDLSDLRYATILKNLLDSIDINDVTQRYATYSHILSDAIDITDSLISSTAVIYSRVLMDYITISDTTTRYINFLRLLTDQIDINDQTIRYLNAFHILNDAIDINDSLTRDLILPGVISRILQDSIDINEAAPRIVSAFHILTDSIDINDSIISFMLASRFLQDNISVLDSIIRSLEIAGAVERILRDSVDINEDLIRIADFTRLLTDNIDLFEALTSTKIGPDKAVRIIMQLIKKEIDLDILRETIKMELEAKDIDTETKKL